MGLLSPIFLLAGLAVAVPLFEGIFHGVAVRRTDVGDVYVEFIPGLGIEETCVACGRELPLSRVNQVENENFVSLMPQETKGCPRGFRVHQEIGQQDYEPPTTQPDGDLAERRVSRGPPLGLEGRQSAKEFVPGT